MWVFFLRVVRRLLREVDIRITRRRFPNEYFSPLPNSHRTGQLRAFLLSLDCPGAAAAAYRDLHLDRLARTLSLAPPPGATGRALELGCYMQMAPALALELGYREVRGAYLGPAGDRVSKAASIAGKEVFRCEIDLFDAERDPFPYPDGYFDLVLACEMIEHLCHDPMHMLLEIRRVLAGGGSAILTTPNCASLTSLACVLHGHANPQVFAAYPRPESGEQRGPHVREYTPSELRRALESAGLRVDALFTERIGRPEEGTWVYDLLARHGFDTLHRGEQIYALATRQPGLVVTRYPSFLYTA